MLFLLYLIILVAYLALTDVTEIIPLFFFSLCMAARHLNKTLSKDLLLRQYFIRWDVVTFV